MQSAAVLSPPAGQLSLQAGEIKSKRGGSQYKQGRCGRVSSFYCRYSSSSSRCSPICLLWAGARLCQSREPYRTEHVTPAVRCEAVQV
eukprot:1035293-Rhodomonas_salina.1